MVTISIIAIAFAAIAATLAANGEAERHPDGKGGFRATLFCCAPYQPPVRFAQIADVIEVPSGG